MMMHNLISLDIEAAALNIEAGGLNIEEDHISEFCWSSLRTWVTKLRKFSLDIG